MSLKNKKILVTGGHGFLGSHLVRLLKDMGIEDVAVPSSKEYDLRRRENCRKVVTGVDVVVHLAAHVGGIGLNLERPAELLFDNVLMGCQLMEEARLAGVEKFLTLGTVCSYPKHTPVPFKEEYLWSGYPEETNAPYGIAKKLLLVQSQAYRQQYGFNAVYLISANLYGPGDNFDPGSSHVIPALIRKTFDAKLGNRDHIVVWGDGTPTREFLHARDAARAILLALERYDKGEPVNVGTGSEISIRDLAELVIKKVGFEGCIKWDTSKPNGQPRRQLDISRAKTELGYEPKIPLEEGLEDTIQWYQQNFIPKQL